MKNYIKKSRQIEELTKKMQLSFDNSIKDFIIKSTYETKSKKIES